MTLSKQLTWPPVMALTHQPWPNVNDAVGMKLAIMGVLPKPLQKWAANCDRCLALSYTRKERTLIQVLPAPNAYTKSYCCLLMQTSSICMKRNPDLNPNPDSDSHITDLEPEVPEWVYALFWCRTVIGTVHLSLAGRGESKSRKVVLVVHISPG